VVCDSTDITSSGRSFQVCGPATGKARLPTVDSLLVGTTATVGRCWGVIVHAVLTR